MIDSPLIALLLLAAIAAVPLLLRRKRASGPDGLRVVARTALSKQSVLAVVAVGPRRLLVGAGDQGVQLLADLPPDDDVDDEVLHLDGRSSSDATTFTGYTTTLPTDVLTTSLDRKDAAEPTPAPELEPALRATVEPVPGGVSAGPGNGLVDRLRAMTVRTPAAGRPFHDLLRR